MANVIVTKDGIGRTVPEGNKAVWLANGYVEVKPKVEKPKASKANKSDK